MLFSEINIEKLSDDKITQLVFDGIDDSGKLAEYGIVFGHYTLYESRVKKAIELYHLGRIKKIVLIGGKHGISNQSKGTKTEVELMLPLLLEASVKIEDILMDETANDTIESCQNLKKIVPPNKTHNIVIITSEYHMKRLLATFKMHYCNRDMYSCVSVKTGYADRENWFLSERIWNSGRSLVEFEAKVLHEYALKGKIADLECLSDEIVR